jgi:hypothetical protein
MCRYCLARRELKELLDATCKLCESRTNLLDLIDEIGKAQRQSKETVATNSEVIDKLTYHFTQVKEQMDLIEDLMKELKIDLVSEIL